MSLERVSGLHIVACGWILNGHCHAPLSSNGFSSWKKKKRKSILRLILMTKCLWWVFRSFCSQWMRHHYQKGDKSGMSWRCIVGILVRFNTDKAGLTGLMLLIWSVWAGGQETANGPLQLITVSRELTVNTDSKYSSAGLSLRICVCVCVWLRGDMRLDGELPSC